MTNLRVFGIGESSGFTKDVCLFIEQKRLEKSGLMCDLGAPIYGPLGRHHEERRPDGEAYTTALDNVRGCDVFVISSLYGDDVESVDEKFMKVALFINTLRHASASRITLVCPYLSYMRQDRKMGSREPIATQAVAMMLEAVGVDRILTMDVHNLGAEQNAFRIPLDNLEARKLLADAIIEDISTHDSDHHFHWKILSPDAGGMGRTKLMQHSLSKRLGKEVGIVYADKTRIDANSVKMQIIGDVKGYNIIAVDDMISTGGTIKEVKKAVEDAGGYFYGVAATHGLFVNGAVLNLQYVPRIFIADTVDPFQINVPKNNDDRSFIDSLKRNVRVVGTASMFAEAIRRIHHEGGSISELLND